MLYRARCPQQGELPAQEARGEQSARQALCSSWLTEVLSRLLLAAVITDPPSYAAFALTEVMALLCWHGAGNACSKLRGSGYLVLPLRLCGAA